MYSDVQSITSQPFLREPPVLCAAEHLCEWLGVAFKKCATVHQRRARQKKTGGGGRTVQNSKKIRARRSRIFQLKCTMTHLGSRGLDW